MKLFWPEYPCQPSAGTHGGSMRPVDPPGPLEPPAWARCDREPGAVRISAVDRAWNRRLAGNGKSSLVFGQELADGGVSAGRIARLTARMLNRPRDRRHRTRCGYRWSCSGWCRLPPRTS